ncbi:MAG: hypothetical protein Q9193_005367, partial [Seirophora villosa]
IASQIGYDLLKQGYRVRGTTRTVESAEALLKGAYSPFAHRVEIVQVPDITPEGAFDEAVKSSPVSFALTSWSSTVDIAVAGAISILDSAIRHAGPRLSSFVFTSSIAACTDPQPPLPKTITENDWNTWAEAKAKSKEFEELDDFAKGLVLYHASKTAAERAVWQWREEKKPPFAVSSINPTIVIGPPLQPPRDPSRVNIALRYAMGMITGNKCAAMAILLAALLHFTVIVPSFPYTPWPRPHLHGALADTQNSQVGHLDHVPGAAPITSYISNYDVSRMHVYAVLHPSECDGLRYLLAAGRATPQALADVLHKIRPQWKDRIPVGEPGSGYVEGYTWMEGGISVDCERAKRALGGGEWMGYEQCVKETVEAFEKHYHDFL